MGAGQTQPCDPAWSLTVLWLWVLTAIPAFSFCLFFSAMGYGASVHLTLAAYSDYAPVPFMLTVILVLSLYLFDVRIRILRNSNKNEEGGEGDDETVNASQQKRVKMLAVAAPVLVVFGAGDTNRVAKYNTIKQLTLSRNLVPGVGIAV
jgi:hypothetical protein